MEGHERPHEHAKMIHRTWIQKDSKKTICNKGPEVVESLHDSLPEETLHIEKREPEQMLSRTGIMSKKTNFTRS